jgi:hypothetical protein
VSIDKRLYGDTRLYGDLEASGGVVLQLDATPTRGTSHLNIVGVP